MPAFLVFFLILLCNPILPTTSFADSRPSAPATHLRDDLDFQGLASSLEKSRHFYETTAEQVFEVCGQRLSSRELGHSYSQLINHLQEQAGHDVALFLAKNFTPCPPTPLLITGYYTPVLPGSLTPSQVFSFPLYGLPPHEHLRTMSRAEIDSSGQLTGHEIVYLADPVDLFFLHVQGSAIIELPDGSSRLVSYAGDNGRPYTSIGKVLIQEGKLSPEEVSLATISSYLTNHPQQRQRILNHNERYIFFRLGPAESGNKTPNGSLGYPLTAGRSVAMDSGHYPPGILGILTGRLPLFTKNSLASWQPFSRLVVHQDRGAAIQGPHRLDLYMGRGQEAGQAAGLMKEQGSFAILIPNLSLRQVSSRIVSAKKLPEPEAKGALTASGE